MLAGHRLDAVIGEGGMGVVFRATHLKLRRTVALKVLPPALAADLDYRRRFEREAAIAASLEHPAVVPIYDAGHENGVLYLSMRFIDGDDLGAVLQREGPLGVERLCALLGPIADALDAVHEAGLVHRDVKPGNVLIARPGRYRGGQVYLCDFGIAKAPADAGGELTSAGAYLGTLQYSSPEQIRGRWIDGRSDQYGLACLAFRGLTGQPPYPRDDSAAVIYAHLAGPPPRPGLLRPDLPAAVDAAVARATAKDPADRFPSCSAFVAALWAAGVAPPADAAPRPAGPATRPPAPAPRPAPPGRPGPRRSLPPTRPLETGTAEPPVPADVRPAAGARDPGPPPEDRAVPAPAGAAPVGAAPTGAPPAAAERPAPPEPAARPPAPPEPARRGPRAQDPAAQDPAAQEPVARGPASAPQSASAPARPSAPAPAPAQRSAPAATPASAPAPAPGSGPAPVPAPDAPPDAELPAPRDVRAERDPGDPSITVTWRAGGPQAVEYKVTRRSPDGRWSTVGRTRTTAITDGAVAPDADIPVYAVVARLGSEHSAEARSAPTAGPPPAAARRAPEPVAPDPDGIPPVLGLAATGPRTLVFEWPDGVTEAMVVVRRDHPPDSPGDPAATSWKITNMRYQLDGGLVLPPSVDLPCHVAVAACRRERGALVVAAGFGPTARATAGP